MCMYFFLFYFTVCALCRHFSSVVPVPGYAFSEDGEHLAYGVSASGSDWVEFRFLRVDGAVALEDRLERVKFSCMAWTHDGKGLFYNSYPEQEGKSDGTHTHLVTLEFCFKKTKKQPRIIRRFTVFKTVSVSGTETSTNLNQKLYYHVLGTPQSQDVLCAEFPDQPKWMSGAEVMRTHTVSLYRSYSRYHIHKRVCVCFLGV